MPDHQEIYRSRADDYERLVSREDCDGNILRALRDVTPLEQLDVVEPGAGTGRLTCLIAPIVRSIVAFDQSPHMLEVAANKLRLSGLKNWRLAVGEHHRVEVADDSADVVLSGWSICYVVVNNPESWRSDLDRVMAELLRVTRPGGYILLLETLGTGETSPNPPAKLRAYYARLADIGFQHRWLRTDYRFVDMEEATSLARFFFGDEMLSRIQSSAAGIVLPECTGLWWLRKAT